MHYFEYVPEITEIFSLNPGTKAFLFDMDGTLINTETLHAKAFYGLLEGQNLENITVNNLYDLCLGQTDEKIFSVLKDHNLLKGKETGELRLAKNALYASFINQAKEEDICLPGVGKLLKDIKSAGHKLALVSSSDRESVETSMKRMDFLELFDLLVTEETTEKNKPHPDPYLYACSQLGESPATCAVFEDSPAGLEAAKSFAPGALIHASWYRPSHD